MVFQILSLGNFEFTASVQQLFFKFERMSFNSLRLEYALEGSSNLIAWTDRMEVVFDDNGVLEYVKTDIVKP